jgi:hypothetical protein
VDVEAFGRHCYCSRYPSQLTDALRRMHYIFPFVLILSSAVKSRKGKVPNMDYHLYATQEECTFLMSGIDV